MIRATVQNTKLMYLGSIDDKVVQYQSIADPERQLLRTLFFSVVLGDPLVLNDGYLLHSAWGRRQLTDPDSMVRRLNKQQHLILVARSSKPYSEWIPEQAERTASYRELLKTCQPEEIGRLDEAWASCVGTTWPGIDLQVTMRRLLEQGVGELLGAEVAPAALAAHRKNFTRRLDARETVRSAWEAAMLETPGISAREQSVLMEFASEAYHASFACGFAGSYEGLTVGIAGFGKRRFHQRDAYQQEDGEILSELLDSDAFQQAKETLRSLATVYVANRERDLFDGAQLANFLLEAEEAKAAYRARLKDLMRFEAPTGERIQALESALETYRDKLQTCFGLRRNPALVQLLNIVQATGEHVQGNRKRIEFVSALIGAVAQHVPVPGADWVGAVRDYQDMGLNMFEALPAVTSVYETLQQRREHPISLLPEHGHGAYELALSPAFVERALDGVPTFGL